MAEPITIIITQGGAGGLPSSGNAVGGVLAGAAAGKVAGLGADSTSNVVGLNSLLAAYDPATYINAKTVGIAMAVAGATWSTTKSVLVNSYSLATDLTGNYIGQSRLNEVLNVAKRVGGLGSSAIKGALAGTAAGKLFGFSGGGGIGAALGIGVAYNQLEIQALTSLGKFGINVLNTNLNASMLRAQSGNGNGSRGTNG